VREMPEMRPVSGKRILRRSPARYRRK
jgi:hypothetical protein